MKITKETEKFFTANNKVKGYENLYAAKVMDSAGQYRLYIYAKTNDKRTTKRVRHIETGIIFESMAIAAKIIGVPASAISDLCHGRRPFGYNGNHFELVGMITNE